MPRLFTGLELARGDQRARAQPEDYHVILRFVGDVDATAQILSLFSPKKLPVLVQTFPVPRNEIPCFPAENGARSTASTGLRGGPAPRRRPVGAPSRRG